MTYLYLDTNIFIYLSDKKSPFYKKCTSLINYCQKNNILIATSTETVQEIIHYAKNTRQLSSGLIVAKSTLALVNEMYPITKNTIDIYLKKVESYHKVKSRDLVHLSVCLENKLNTIVTYDKEFRIFKEVKSLRPEDIFSN